MKGWLQCGYGHVFHANDMSGVTCPKCGPSTTGYVPQAIVEIVALPESVVLSVRRFARDRHLQRRDLMNSMTYSRVMGCYGFTLDGVFYGIEADGFLHS